MSFYKSVNFIQLLVTQGGWILDCPVWDTLAAILSVHS